MFLALAIDDTEAPAFEGDLAPMAENIYLLGPIYSTVLILGLNCEDEDADAGGLSIDEAEAPAPK